jgi:hypothetical protein
MTYCTLEEAWGEDWVETKKQKKRSKRDRKLEKEEKHILKAAVDPQILIPDTYRMGENRGNNYQMSDYRKDISDDSPLMNEYPLSGFDNSMNNYSSPYQRFVTDPLKRTDESVLLNNKRLQQPSIERTIKEELPTSIKSITEPVSDSLNDMIQISKSEYNNLKKGVVEGFSNQTDEQFNQLILYIFTGILYILMLDMMYQLGKKSY